MKTIANALVRGWVLGARPADVACDLMRDHGYLLDPEHVVAAYAVFDTNPNLTLAQVIDVLSHVDVGLPV